MARAYLGPIAVAALVLGINVLRTAPAAAADPLKVACTGTSAMRGVGSSEGHHVPDELGKLLGAGFMVQNFAKQGATAIKAVDASYAASDEMKAALAANPDVVLFWFGGNDSMQGTWETHKSEFKADYTSMVQQFQALPSHPKTFLVRLWVFVDAPVRRMVLDQEILPIIDEIAAETGSTLIDYREAFADHADYFPDGMHPNDTGTLAIGKLFADTVTTTLAASSGGSSGAGGVAGAGAGGSAAGGGGAGATAGTASEGGAPGAAGSVSLAGGGLGGSGGAGTAPLPAGGSSTAAPASSASAADSGGCSASGARSSLWQGLLLGLVLAASRARRRTC